MNTRLGDIIILDIYFKYIHVYTYYKFVSDSFLHKGEFFAAIMATGENTWESYRQITQGRTQPGFTS